MRDLPARLADTGHGLDVQLFARLAVSWHLTDRERAVVLALSSDQYAQWLTGDIDADVATAVGARLGHLLAIDLAANAFYGSGTELAAGAVRRSGTAPNGVDSAFPLLSGSVDDLIVVRVAFEARSGGAHIITVAPALLGRDDLA
jgi:hypothetical protein